MRPRSIALCLMPALLPPPAYPTIHRHERGYTPGPMVPATYYGCSPPPLRLLRTEHLASTTPVRGREGGLARTDAHLSPCGGQCRQRPTP